MMRITKPIFGTMKYVVMESGFFVMRGILGMLAHGVYRTTVINKKRYWPKYCKGCAIAACFQDK